MVLCMSTSPPRQGLSQIEINHARAKPSMSMSNAPVLWPSRSGLGKIVGYPIKRCGNCYECDGPDPDQAVWKGRTMRSGLAIAVAGAILSVAAAPALAHHAFSSEFDVKKPIHFTG